MYTRFILILLFTFSVTVQAASGGASYSNGKANYYPLEPALVVNLHDGKRMRFMQVKVQVMTRDTDVITALQENNPAIRHELLMLLSHQSIAAMRDVQTREKVRQQALQQLGTVLKTLTGLSAEKTVEDPEGNKHPSGIQALYFTDFVIQ